MLALLFKTAPPETRAKLISWAPPEAVANLLTSQ
jgi:hypothetical protein